MGDKRILKLAILATVFCMNNIVNCLPNIVIFMVDDVGRNDFSMFGSDQIPTYNLDALGYNGKIFNRYYSMHICTPSRAALLTGKFPIRTGMQGAPLSAGEPRALPLDIPTFAEQLRKLGYCTSMIGKWHLGYQTRSVCPPARGFDSYLGYWNGLISYFDYQAQDLIGKSGYDLHRDYAPSYAENNTYATHVFTQEAIKVIENQDQSCPLFLHINHLAGHTGSHNGGTELGVPNVTEAILKFNYILDPRRILYAEIISQVDKSLGYIVETLSKTGMLNNTIILCMSDNGAPTVGYFANTGSNWPFRGIKQTLSEGAVRNYAALWSPDLLNTNIVIDSPVHIVDWLPTLYEAAGGNVQDLGIIDGVSHWKLLTQGTAEPTRPDILLNIDEAANYAAIISSDGQFKYTSGRYQGGIFDDYYGDSGRSPATPKMDPLGVILSKVNVAIQKVKPNPLTVSTITNTRLQLEVKQSTAPRLPLFCDPCLFNLFDDPTETRDISAFRPDIVQQLKASLAKYRSELHPQTNTAVDPNSDPANCNGTWHTWLDPVHPCN